jgi:HPt (histidine-containing phosphotransfer) domain-containing protein
LKWDKLKKEVHNLKGMGGNFGYPQLSELAERLERQLAAGNYPAIESMLLELEGLVRRISAGLRRMTPGEASSRSSQ